MMSFFTDVTEKARSIFSPRTAKPDDQTNGQTSIVASGMQQNKEEGIFKAYIPEFLYKPPFGYPRKENILENKDLAKNPYVFSVIKTICDEATCVDWEIKVKDEFNDGTQNYDEKIKEITQFLKNPNGNEESFESLLRKVITGIIEVDTGLIIKVFNEQGELKHLLSRDGATFLKNPNIYGMISERSDFVPPIPQSLQSIDVQFQSPDQYASKLINQYDLIYKSTAAYFQYGWTAGHFPIPFGKREVVWIEQNPRPDTIYGRSPISSLKETILNLIYGQQYNLDFYANNNMPKGVAVAEGVTEVQAEALRDRVNNKTQFIDDFNKTRMQHYQIPVISQPFQFVPFNINPAEMQILEQQKWFTKVMWMNFGVTAEEMGFTEDSNKAVSQAQQQVAKRKAVKPILNVIQYHLNTQIIPEFFSQDLVDEDGEKTNKMANPAEVPLQLEFDDYDIEQDIKTHTLLEQQIRMGVKTPEMAAEDLGIDLEQLKQQKEENMQREVEHSQAMGSFNQNNNFKQKDDDTKEPPNDSKKEKKEVKEKSANPLKEIEEYIDGIGDSIAKSVENSRQETL